MADGGKKQANPLGLLGGALGAVVGYAVANYSAMNMLIPGLSAVLIGVVLSKLVSPSRKPLVAAFAVQAGQAVWFFVGAVALSQFSAVILDLVALAVGLTWLLVRPGLIPVLICGIYQLIGLAVNILSISQASFGSPAHRALVVHILLRCVAVLFLIVGLQSYRKKMAAASEGALVGASPGPMPPGPPLDETP